MVAYGDNFNYRDSDNDVSPRKSHYEDLAFSIVLSGLVYVVAKYAFGSK